jgi:hypothetical protein
MVSIYFAIIEELFSLIESNCLVIDVNRPAVASSIFLSNSAEEVEAEAWDNIRLQSNVHANKYTINQ